MRPEEFRIKTALKMLMRKQRIQHQDLAAKLGVSTATIKRRLNQGELSLSDLADLADALGSSVYEIIELSQAQGAQAYLFSEEQEKLFAKDLTYLLLFRLILMEKGFVELRRQLRLSELELRRRLRRLEDLKLIKLMPQNRIVCLANFPFKWREDGPLQKAYFKKNIAALLSHLTTKIKRSTYEPESGRLCKPFEYYLTTENRLAFAKELMAVYAKYRSASQMDLIARDRTGTVVSGLLLSDQFSIWEIEGLHPGSETELLGASLPIHSNGYDRKS